MADRVTVVGIDQYGGGSRPVQAEIDGAHVLLTCGGNGEGGQALLTPDQAHFLGMRLGALAMHVSAQFDNEPEPA